MVLKGFEHIQWNKVLLWHQIAAGCHITPIKRLVLQVIIRPFRCRTFRFNLLLDSQSHILSIQESSRKSNKRNFEKLCKLLPTSILQFTPDTPHWHIKEGVKLVIKYIPSWKKELKRNGYKQHEIITIIPALIELWFLKANIPIIDYSQYKLVVTFFDAEFFQGYFSEIARLNGIKTATLQHGQFTAYREKTFENSGVELRCFKSDYFLCWNQMTIDEGIKEGIPLDCFVKTGILGYIGSKYQECTKPNNDTFGVVLGHPMFEEENLALIEAANILAKAKGIKYYLKLHPNYIDTHFSKYIEPTLYIGNIAKGIPILEYANMVDFSIVGSSSVFAELVYIQHDVIRYSSGDIKDKYRDIHLGRYFTNPQEIIEVYSSVEETNNKELFDYICSVKDVTASYKSFLMPFTS